jgi:uncharacterized protein YbjT (DUF2867 family)
VSSFFVFGNDIGQFMQFVFKQYVILLSENYKKNMKTALVIGASGLVGTALIKQLENDDWYDSIRILVRKKIDGFGTKVEQIIFDFDKPQIDLVVANDVFCCMGTTIGIAGSKEAFKKVDFVYPLEIAKIALQNGATKFALVSSMGANKKSAIFYSRVKGEIEDALSALNYPSLYIFRPSMLQGNRLEYRPGEKSGQKVMNALSFIIPDKYKVVHVDKVATSMIAHMKSEEKGNHIILSDVIQKA